MLEQLHNNAVALLLFILGSKIVISTEVTRQDNMLSQGTVLQTSSDSVTEILYIKKIITIIDNANIMMIIYKQF